MSLTLQVKTGVRRTNELLWLNLTDCKILKSNSQTQTLLTPDGRCFSVLKGQRRNRWLERRGYDPTAVWESQGVQP